MLQSVEASASRLLSIGCVCSMKIGSVKPLSPVPFELTESNTFLIQRAMLNQKVLQMVYILQNNRLWMVFKVFQT